MSKEIHNLLKIENDKTTIFTKKADIERLKKDSEMFGTTVKNRCIKDIKLAKVVTYLKMTAMSKDLLCLAK